jgi:hypothetical protein
MKKLALVFSLLVAAGLVYAQTPPYPQEQPPTKADPAMAKSEKSQHIEAEVVSVDATAKTITFKKDMGAEPQTLPVEGKALTALKDVMTGQKYRLFCKNDTAGSPKSIVDIKKPTGKDSKPE